MPKIKKPKTAGEQESPAELSWRAAEYDYREKDAMWYLLVGAFALALVVIALWQQDFFFAVFILISAALVIALGRRRPDILEFRLTREGCHLGEKLFCPYDALENFSITERPGLLDEIILKRKTSFNPYLRILLDGQTAEKAREILRAKLPETVHEETFMDIFTRFLGF